MQLQEGTLKWSNGMETKKYVLFEQDENKKIKQQ